MKQSRSPVVLLTLGLALFGALDAAQALTTTRFDLRPVNTGCLPRATGRVTVFHTADSLGVDSLQLRVRGLPADTGFAVFLTSADAFDAPPFGAAAYIADFTTNAAGAATVRVAAIVAEAFVSKREGDPPMRIGTDLDHLVFWFADPAEVPACFNFSGSTPFDGDGNAGPAAMSSQGATGLELTP